MSTINQGFLNNSPQAVDNSYGSLVAGRTTPFVSAAAACTVISAAFRYRGKTVIIDPGDGTGAYEWWWRVGTADANLTPKILSEQALEFVIGDGGLYTPAANSTTYTNPNLINCAILGFGGDQGGMPSVARTGFQSYQYNPTSGVISLVNTKFSTNAWFKVNFRQL